MSNEDPYENSTNKVMERLRGHVDLPDNKLKFLARLLVLAANYGSGDAIAGYQLQGASEGLIKQAAEILKLKTIPRIGTVQHMAMSLLDRESEDPEITTLLKELDQAAISGKGYN